MAQQYTYEQMAAMYRQNHNLCVQYQQQLNQLNQQSNILRMKIEKLKQMKSGGNVDLTKDDVDSVKIKGKNGHSIVTVYSEGKNSGIKIEHWDKKDARGMNMGFYLLITVDLTKHNDPNAYENKIKEICNFIKNNRLECVIPISNHTREGNNYLIQCISPYSYTFKTYNSEQEIKRDELHSEFYDLLQIKKELETTLKNYPAALLNNDYSLILRKTRMLPFPQICISPASFILGYLRGLKQSNICDAISKCVEFLTNKYQATKNYLEFKEFGDFIKNKPTEQDIEENAFVKNVIKSRKMKPLEITNNNIQLKEVISCGAYGMVYSCTYNGQEYAIKESVGGAIEDLKKESFIITNSENPFIIKAIGFTESPIKLCELMKDDLLKVMGEKYGISGKQLLDRYNNFCGKPEDKHGYLLMEKCDFGTLEEFTKKTYEENGEETRWDLVKTIFGQIVHACRYLLKEKRMVHRDLKPENILIKSDGENPIVKLCDFGFTRAIAAEMTTQAGTPAFADHKIIDNKEYGEETDLYSLGCILYYLAYAKLPFGIVNDMDDLIGYIKSINENTDIGLNPDDYDDDDPDEFVESDLDWTADDGNGFYKCVERLLRRKTEDGQPLTWNSFLNHVFTRKCLIAAKSAEKEVQ